MKITVVSDTHRNFDVLYEIVSRNQMSDLFIHLGDGEHEFEDVRSIFYDKAFVYVRGNNDWGDYPAYSRLSLGGHNFYICHGHNFDRYELKNFLSATAASNKCDIALFGHTHVPCSEELNGVHLFNPGSASLPRGNHPPSYGIIEINETINTINFNIKEI